MEETSINVLMVLGFDKEGELVACVYDGRNVLQEPVFPMAATVGYDIGVTGRSFMLFGILLIDAHYCLS